MASFGAFTPLQESSGNLPQTPPVHKMKGRLPPQAHVTTPMRPVKASAVPTTPSTPLTRPTANPPPPSTGKRARSRSVPPRRAFEAELSNWDKAQLIATLMEKEEAALNLAEDVAAWEDKWNTLQSDGQALYQEYVTQSMRAKRYAEMVAALRLDLETAQKQNVGGDGRTARESALLNQNVTLQKRLEELSAQQKGAQDSLSRLQLQLADAQAAALRAQAAESVSNGEKEAASASASSPQRRLEALSIRTEALRSHNASLEERLRAEQAMRGPLETQLIAAKAAAKAAQEEVESHRARFDAAALSWAEEKEQQEQVHAEEKMALYEQVSEAQDRLRALEGALAHGQEASAGQSIEVRQLKDRITTLEGEVVMAQKEAQDQRAKVAQTEEDMRLLYAKQKSELRSLDARYNHKAYKARYQGLLAQQSAQKERLNLALNALQQLPAMAASAHILAGLLQAGVDGVSAQQRVLVKRRETLQQLESAVKSQEDSFGALRNAVERDGEKVTQLERTVTELTEERTRLVGAHQAQDATIASLKSRLADLELELAAAQVTRTALKEGERSAWAAEVTSLRDGWAKESAALKEALQEEQKNFAQLQDTLKGLESAIAERRITDEEREFVAAEQQARLGDELEAAHQELNQLREARGALLGAAQALTCALEATREKLQMALTHWEQERARASALESNLSLVTAQLRDVLGAWKGTVRVLKVERERRTTQKQHLARQLATVKAAQSQDRSQFEEKLLVGESELQRLHEELHEAQTGAQNRVQALERMLAAAQQQEGRDRMQSQHLEERKAWEEALRKLQEEHTRAAQVEKEQAQALAQISRERDELAFSLEQVKSAPVPSAPVVSDPSKPAAESLMKEWTRTLLQVTQECDARVAQERAQVAGLKVKLQSLEDQADLAREAERDATLQLQQARLLAQQLLLQLEVALTVAPGPTDLREVKAEMGRVQREALQWRQKAEEKAAVLEGIQQDRQHLKAQLLEAQHEYSEKIGKVQDEPWKKLSRQHKQLWLKFQGAQDEEEKEHKEAKRVKDGKAKDV